jgi:hypothetical protein
MELPSLSFRPGVGVQLAIRQRFGEPVNYFPIQGLKEFFMVVSVGRCKYELSEYSIGMILQATLGGAGLILGQHTFLAGFSNFLLLQEMWAFTFSTI